ncbi:MAG: hypothetical protein WAM14_18890 [Candidatus Nitrosopolaris sp.]
MSDQPSLANELALLKSSGVLKAVKSMGLEVFENGEHGPVIIKG